MSFKLPELPFNPTAVQSWFSKETVEFHYGKHHNAYVTKLNELIPGTPFEKATLEEMINQASGGIYNNAAQAWNHTFFWYCIGDQPAHTNIESYAKIRDAIVASFGSCEQFIKEFTNSGATLFGSGWVWLTLDAQTKKLGIVQTQNADNPMKQGLIPLLVCDVWEHAYYIDFRNARAKFLESFSKSINWKHVSEQYQAGAVMNITQVMSAK